MPASPVRHQVVPSANVLRNRSTGSRRLDDNRESLLADSFRRLGSTNAARGDWSDFETPRPVVWAIQNVLAYSRRANSFEPELAEAALRVDRRIRKTAFVEEWTLRLGSGLACLNKTGLQREPFRSQRPPQQLPASRCS